MSSKSHILFGKVLNIGYILGFTRVKWDRRTGRLTCDKSHYRFIWQIIQLALVIVYEIFLCYQSLRPLDPQQESAGRFRVRYLAVLWIFLNCNHFGTIFADEYVSLMNGTWDLNLTQQSKQKRESTKGAGTFIKVVAFVATFSTVNICITALMRPTSLQVLSSLFASDAVKQSWWTRGLNSALHYITFGFYMFAFWLQSSSVVLFSNDMVQKLNDMLGDCRIYRVNFAKNQRTLSVLSGNFAAFYKHYVTLIQTGSIICVVMNSYQAVIFRRHNSFIVALAVTFGHSRLLETSAQVYHKSSAFLEDWRRKNSGRWFTRFMKSCRPVCIPVGGFFYVDKRMTLTVLSIIANTSASLILAH